MITALVIIAVVVYGVLHLGHRGAKRRGQRGLSSTGTRRAAVPTCRSRCRAASGSGIGCNGYGRLHLSQHETSEAARRADALVP